MSNIKASIHNSFNFVIKDAATKKVIKEYKAENIILNNFWGSYLSSASKDSFKYIHFGSGIAQPVATDTKLTSWLGYKASSISGAGVDFSEFKTQGIIKILRTCRLQDTEFVGSSISEVGFSSSTSGTTALLTKALVKDMNGNVVSIPKASGQIIDIFATFYVKVNLSYLSGDITFGGYSLGSTSSREFLKCLCGNDSWANSSSYNSVDYCTIPANLVGINNANSMGGTSVCPDSYTNIGGVSFSFNVASKQLIISVANLIASVGNQSDGIKLIKLLGSLNIKVPNSVITQPIIVKEIIGTGDGSLVDFNTKFGSIKDNGTFKFYVNDVEVPATVKYNQPLHTPGKTTFVAMMNVIDYSTYHPVTKEPILSVPFGGACNSAFIQAVQMPYIYTIFENPLFGTYGIDSVSAYSTTIYCSDDMVSWTLAVTASSNIVAVPSQYKNKRYWKAVPNREGYACGIYGLISTLWESQKLITLSSPPSVGTALTATYQPDCLAKYDQRVLNNVAVTITFNEYTP